MTDTTTIPRTSSPLPIRSVVIADDFWAPRRELVRTRTLPHQERQLREGGQFEALRLQWRPGDPGEPHVFWESDIAKWIEAASYSLATHPDPALDASIDEAIALLAGAQQDDGYLNAYFTVVKPGERFTDLRDAHELYCAGHLIEAAVAHHQATGKTTLLDVVRRYVDLIDQVLSTGGAAAGGYDGHEEIELALVKLARATGEDRYRDLALRMIDARGTEPYFFEQERARRGTEGYFASVFPDRPDQPQRFREYSQSHLPVREQTDAVGHSVRAMYLYSAMTDLAVDTGDPGLETAVERLWTSTTERKMYATGGLGSDPSIEGFGPDFDLDLDTAYAETCAAIGLVFWSHRMALLTGEGRYADVLERALYNGVLAGASDDGTRFFYGNPMRSDGTATRSDWFGVACCPPNLARLLQSLEYYAYAQRGDTAVVDLHISGSAEFAIGTGVRLEVHSTAPWRGRTRVTVRVDETTEFELALRIPGWSAAARVTIAGESQEPSISDGYTRIRRRWTDGDVVELELGIVPERIHDPVEVGATAGRVALRRGPFIYCFEGLDNAAPASRLALPDAAALHEHWDAERGLVLLKADGLAEPDAAAARPAPLIAVPYFSWANRGASTMEIWIRDADTGSTAATEDASRK